VDAWAQAAALLTDYRLIQNSQEGRLLRSPDTVQWHEPRADGSMSNCRKVTLNAP